MHYAMVVDLNLCIGCNTCVVACKAENGTPPGIFFNKVLEQEIGTFPSVRRVFWPMRCMQCEEPVCLEVCATNASYKREDGIVVIDGNKCVGCKACILACPYEARQIWDGKGYYFNNTPTPYELRAYTRHVPGTVLKCDFCADRLDRGLKPYCVQTCITNALIFGDLDDHNSDVRQALARETRTPFKLKEELGTSPSIYYLA